MCDWAKTRQLYLQLDEEDELPSKSTLIKVDHMYYQCIVLRPGSNKLTNYMIREHEDSKWEGSVHEKDRRKLHIEKKKLHSLKKIVLLQKR